MYARTTKSMNWPALGEQAVFRIPIPDDTMAPKSAEQRWPPEQAANIGAGVWMGCRDGSHSDNGGVEAIAVSKLRIQWRVCDHFLVTGCTEVFNAALWALGLALDVAIDKRDTLLKHTVKTLAVFSDAQAAIRLTAHHEPDRGQQLAWRIH